VQSLLLRRSFTSVKRGNICICNWMQRRISVN
jgi:hypothetical protein